MPAGSPQRLALGGGSSGDDGNVAAAAALPDGAAVRKRPLSPQDAEDNAVKRRKTELPDGPCRPMQVDPDEAMLVDQDDGVDDAPSEARSTEVTTAEF